MSNIKSLFIGRAHEKKSFKTDLLVLLIYAAGIIFVTCFHEPWFDETQAWQIAKCASFKEILTYIPHYEGHPPLWHLILSVFAKNGAPVDLTLKAINTVFSVTAMAILIFRSPFPKIVRYLLPFNFYFFYQYGVLSRPYSLAMIVFFLMAITYRNRNVKPWRYILSLTLLCLVSAYGIMLAGGLCIVWTFEIISELIRNKKVKFFWKDMRFYSLCFILAAALVLVMLLIPADDCYYLGADSDFTIFDRLTYYVFYEYFFIMPFDSWSGVIMDNFAINELPVLCIVEMICGILMWVGLSAFTLKNKKFFTFFLPYVIMTGFMAFKYGAIHHLGLGTLFHVFIFWIMAEQDGGIAVPDFLKKLNSKLTSPLSRKFVAISGAFVCIAPIIYSVNASISEVKDKFCISYMADYIKENHIEDAKIMMMWDIDYDESQNGDDDGNGFDMFIFKKLEIPSEHLEITANRTNIMGGAVMIGTYFDRNIFMNFNVEAPDDLYMHYRYKEDVDKVFELWRQKGLPDFIIGYCPIDEVYDEETLEGVKYLPVKLIEYSDIGKVLTKEKYMYFYMREDLFDDYPQFEWINDQTGNVYERKPKNE